jgi:membrane-bound lytic murein transglycosylase D
MKSALIVAAVAWVTHGASQDSTWSIRDSIMPEDLLSLNQEAPDLDSSLFEYETEWLNWLSTHHCSSSDTVLLNIRDYAEHEVPVIDTAELKIRMALLSAASPMDLDWNPVVHSRVRFYASKRKKHLGKMLGRAPAYFPIFEQALDRHDLPMELKYLPVVESGLNPTARSHAGARGLWQFMYATAKYQGLRIDSYIDERRDPYRSSEAACAFLSKLYDTYGDWYLALAAYNAGPGNVNRAIRRSGGKRNFWEIRFFLPRETRNYVPAFMAVVYLMEYSAEHNIYPIDIRPPHALLDTVIVNEVLRFDQIAEAVGLNPSDISHLNPMYRLDIIPATIEQWPLVLPSSKIPAFLALQDSVKKIMPELTPDIVFVPEPVTYRVKSGDVLGKIADRYGVSVRQLREWNDLSGSMIRIGQKLLIHANPKSH